MASTPATRLVLLITAGIGAEARLAAALAGADAASVIIAAAEGAPLDAASAKPLVDLAQARGAAALLVDEPNLARTVKADGVHLSWSADLMARHTEARDIVGRGAIVGVDAGNSRHDAMEAAEAGADYVAFGPQPDAAGDETAADERLDLVQWWADIFEPPVVAFAVATAVEARELAGVGADFVAVRVPEALLPNAASRWLVPYREALNSRKVVA